MIQLKELQKTLMERLEQSPDLSDRQILELIDDMLLEKSHGWALTLEMRGAMRKELFDSVRRLDVIQDLIDDPKVTEIMVNGFDRIFVERGGIVSRYPKSFTSREKLEDVVQQIVGKCNRIINESSPIVDARLENGSRVNVVVEPACIGGPVLTIRRFPDSPITMERLIAMGSITQEAAGFLEELVKSGYSILIGGGTSAGKTTFLNALSHYIPGDERIITIEDTAELQIQGIENLVRLEARSANMEGGRQITKTALRMRPNRIIVGEVRQEEAIDLLQAWNTGHDGSIGTLHANSTADMISRLETMVLMGMQLPLEAIRRQIASGVDIMVHLGRRKDKKRRVLEISEVTGYAPPEVLLQPLYRWDDKDSVLRRENQLMHREKLERMRGYEA